MRPTHALEFPPEQEQSFRRAKRLEWLTIAYLLSVGVVMYLVLGSSQAMKTAWIEDLLSLIPPIAFLVAGRVFSRRPNHEFPYGYHRATTIAFLCGAVALFAMGLYLLFDSLMKLVMAEHPTIGNVQLFGQTLWLGWLMLLALTWSAVPAFFIGRAKLPFSRKLHDKVLFTDANMNKADWMTATAAMAGILGIGWGLWWADAAAAAFISLNVTYDGFQNLRTAVTDLMDRVPQTVDHRERDPLCDEVIETLRRLDWVEDTEVRLREEGHVFFGEAFVVPASEENLVDKVEQAMKQIAGLSWRLLDVVVVPVRALPDEGEGLQEASRRHRGEAAARRLLSE